MNRSGTGSCIHGYVLGQLCGGCKRRVTHDDLMPPPKQPRRARVYIHEVRVECPHCEEPIPSYEDDTGWGECVGGETGERDCPECGKRIIVPPVYERFGTPLRFRRRRL